MAIDACAAIKATSILVVCPAIARRHWASQFKLWGGKKFPHVRVFEDTYGGHAPGSVSIIAYSALSLDTQLHRALQLLDYDVLIVDEAHYAKGISRRADAIFGGQGGNVT